MIEEKNISKTPNEPKPISRKHRLGVAIGGGVGIILLIVISIFLFTAPAKVSFNTGGGSTIDRALVAENGKIQKPKDPIRFGWIFKGWYATNGFTGDPIDFDEYVFAKKNSLTDQPEVDKDGKLILKSATIYAKWSLQEFKVTYELNGGKNNSSNPDTYTIKHEATEEDIANGLENKDTQASGFKLSDPTKSGATFMGWYTDKNFTKKVTELDRVSPKDITLYAKWSK